MSTGHSPVDANTLQWVKSEIDETLKQARNSLEAAVDTPDDESQLPEVANYLHQVRGTLQIVELYGASMVADELEQLAIDLSEKRIEARDEIYEVLMRAMLQLPDYLERLQAGYKDIPIVLLPLLNDLRAARGKPLLTETALFNPDLAVEIPAISGGTRQDSLPELAKKLRHAYHLGLLDWYQDRDTVAGLNRLDKVIQQLREAADDTEVNRVLWSASGVLEALQEGGLETSVAVKLLLGQVDRQIKKIIDHGESALTEEPPTELEKNLLYYVASSTTDGERVSALKKTFKLKEALPDAETLEQARADLSGPNADLMQTVSAVLLENLLRVKDALDVFVRADDRDNHSLKEQCDDLDQLSDTLGMLGFGEQRQIMQEQIDILTEMSNGSEDIDEAALMDVAQVLLSVEAVLQGGIAPGQDDKANQATAHADDAVQYELLSSVIAEAKSEMDKVKEVISSFIETPSDIDLLSDVPAQLDSISGGFNMLSLGRPAQVIKRCRDYIQSEMIERQQPQEPATMDALADALSSIEYYMDSLVGKWGNPQAILDVAEQRLRHIMPTPAVLDAEQEDDEAVGESSSAATEAAMAEQLEQDDTLIDEGAPHVEVLEQDTGEAEAEAMGEEGTALEGLDDSQLLTSFGGDELPQEGEDAATAIQEPAEQPATDRLVESSQLQNLEQLLAQWYTDVHAKDAVSLLREEISALKHLTKEQAQAEAGKIVADIDALVRSTHKGETTLTDDVKNSLHFALDTLHDILLAETAVSTAQPPATPEETGAAQEQAARPAPVMEEIDDEIIEIFMEEANEELEKINRLLPLWQENPADEAALKDLRRSFHTLKGSGRLVGATDVGEFAWAFEDILNRVISKSIETSPVLFVALEEARQELPRLFEQFRKGEQAGQQVHALMEFARQLSSGQELTATDSDEAAEQTGAATPLAAVIPEIDATLLSIYRKEVASHLASLQQYVQHWNEDVDRSVNQELIRALHTLSGSSRTAGVAALAEVFGQLEKYALHLASSDFGVNPETVAVIEASIQYVNQFMPLLDSAGSPMPANEELCEQIEALYATESSRIAPSIAVETPAVMQEEGSEAVPVLAPDPELLDIFIEEGMEILDESDHVLHKWPQDKESRDHLDAMQRHLHTLKGGARLARLSEVSDLIHSVESMLTALLEGQLQLTDEFFEVMLHAQDALVQMIEQARLRQPLSSALDIIQLVESVLASPASEPSDVTPELIAEMDAVDASATDELAVEEEQAAADAAGLEAVETPLPDNVVPLVRLTPAQADTTDLVESDEGIGRELVRVKLDLLDNLVNFAGEVSIFRSRLEQQNSTFGVNLQELDDTVNRLRDQLRKFEIEAEAQIQYRSEDSLSRTQEEFDPLEFDRFTHMQQLSRGMMESLNDLDSLRTILSGLTRESETLLVQQSRVNTELQEGLMRTRMVPFSSQASRLRRIVRQTALDMGKKAELHLHGADGELDRTVLERLLPALEHMLRNAVAHGIEYPEGRKAAAKPEMGQINLALSREGGNILLHLTDDGAGIDLEAIQKKAIEKGKLKQGVRASQEQLFDLIMESGFSTANEVTQIAGRGVGMDVVNNEIKQLGGVLNIKTEQGAGASFTISLPLSLSVTRALMVNVGEEMFALPLLSVEGVERIDSEELHRLHSEEKPVFKWLEQDYPFFHLGSIMGVAESPVAKEHGKVPLLLVRSGEYRAAVQVDNLIGSREIVVNPVGPQLSTLRGISGATIMGDGSVVLVIDLGVLVRLSAAHELAPAVTTEASPAEAHLPLVMVVDDSITVRKVTSRLLERHNYAAVSAKDGVDALAQLQELSPDIILLDVEMPRMDGFEFAKNIRNDEKLKAIPIIMITSRTGQKHRDRAEAIGVNVYMGKPFSEVELLDNIQQLLQQ